QTINANVTGQNLYVNPGNVVTNLGTIKATNGGNLVVGSTTINNNGGLITTDSGHGSGVFLNSGANIQGGTIAGNVQTNGGTSNLDGTTHGTLTNNGVVTLNNNNQLNVFGTINNTGSLLVSAAGNGTVMYAGNGQPPVIFTGGGTITLSDTTHSNN